ncbi:diguanylate cyclase (GGDEF)-like protein [Roseibium hamelinense]|uniref:Diguanylate cyclase (GGDEF)-like protein n=2 Tax=Roseibium hamelinense TaxID=150831 RepID=A0A562TG90_9HYPH|nr:diguanylate cyclase (GGDEF)-like protein [Roseibium hamelinense]
MVPSGNPELTLAQFRALHRQIPLVYFVCLFGGWTVVANMWGQAPLALVLYYPVAVTAFAIYRLSIWSTGFASAEDPTHALRRLRSANRMAVLNPVLYGAWAMALFPYGDPFAQGQIVFTVGICNVACTFCMLHLRSATIMNALVVNPVYFSYFAWAGDGVFIYFALCGIVVSLVAVAISNFHYKDFVRLVLAGQKLHDQQAELEKKNTELQRLNSENDWLAKHDPLTGLPNRRLYFAELSDRYEKARREARPIAVCVFDLGGFKPINDIYGHEVGDSLLVEIANRLRHSVPGVGIAARLGGDEFAVVIDTASSPADAEQRGRRVLNVFETGFKLPEGTVRISGYVGVAVWPQTSTTSTELHEQALYALQTAKRDPSCPFAVFGNAQADEMRQTVLLERALLAPDLTDEIYCAFQPQMNIRTNTVTGLECLARWNSPDLGQVPPGLFIPVAERAGLINRLTLLLLEKALKEVHRWPSDLHLSFNLSPSNLSSKGFIYQMLELVKKHGFPASRLEVEITETAVMWDFEQAKAAIEVLKEVGIGIALDDFGTGYSSLKHIHLLPLDKIKVDRSFVRNIRPNSTSYGIVKSLLNLSRDMGISCVVEGVETAEELLVLQNLGAEYIQGYFFSKPIKAEEVGSYVADYRPVLKGDVVKAS